MRWIYSPQVVTVFLQGVISTTIDLTELHSPGVSPMIYADIESSSKLGGLRAVAKIIETQNSLFSSRSKIISAERDSLKQRSKQSKKTNQGYEAKKVALEKTLEVTLDRLDATKKLNAKEFAQKAALLLELEAKEAITDIAILPFIRCIS